MMILNKSSMFFILFMLNINACTTILENSKTNIYDTWTIEKIIYDDKSMKMLGDGNFVTIKENHILETIKNYGNRRYSYVQNNRTLNLTSGGEVIIWKIIQDDNRELRIKTPIGLYLLTR